MTIIVGGFLSPELIITGGFVGSSANPLVLDQSLYATLLSPDTDPFGIDPGRTAVIATLDDNPFGIDPNLTTETP